MASSLTAVIADMRPPLAQSSDNCLVLINTYGSNYLLHRIVLETNTGVMRWPRRCGVRCLTDFDLDLEGPHGPQTLAHLVRQKIHLVLDGHSAHRANRVPEWVTKRSDRLRLR
ncbi:hypothetical protein [Natronoglycomyces albus]|uniref:Uncharacterized protein n=1 Tax=Natronoglycomyces albus TaxID=2811108 RepID=A0A895XNB2_9ACTN|nr:hypothetical protein [Natronoglycomyces albus]QSB03966.1 hypothetical protein JQS30_09020 [Natronoglycomyces albus]